METIWKTGDPWRDLTDEIMGATETVHIITENGTIHSVNWLVGWRIRIGNHHRHMYDGMKQYMNSFDCTPCGVNSIGPENYIHSTQVVGVFLDADLEDLRQWYADTEVVPIVGHPEGACYGLYCVNKNEAEV